EDRPQRHRGSEQEPQNRLPRCDFTLDRTSSREFGTLDRRIRESGAPGPPEGGRYDDMGARNFEPRKARTLNLEPRTLNSDELGTGNVEPGTPPAVLSIDARVARASPDQHSAPACHHRG